MIMRYEMTNLKGYVNTFVMNILSTYILV